MKVIFILSLIVSLIVLLSVPALAGDFANLNFIGFSRDGKYLSFEEYGVQDGSGFPYSNIFFVDVDKNSFAAPAIKIRLDNEAMSEQQARTRAKRSAAPVLSKFRILERNTGTALVSRLLTDIDVNHFLALDAEKPRTVNFAEIIGSMYREGDYELTLHPGVVKTKECDIYEQPIYKLELTLKDNMQDKSITLQKDAMLPASRGCPISYAIQHVYVYQNNIAVFINSYTTGFEGPDMRYLVVTGKYK